ncbi:TPA: hypothetical protein ACN3KN_002856 [Enterococcus faecium]
MEFGTTGGRGSEFCFRTTTPHSVPSANFCAKKCFILTVPMDRAFFFRPPFDRRFDRRFEK